MSQPVYIRTSLIVTWSGGRALWPTHPAPIPHHGIAGPRSRTIPIRVRGENWIDKTRRFLRRISLGRRG